MAVAVYYSWDRLGRPLEPATPIREIVERLKVAYPRAASLFSWYANEAHYQAEPPQDHTPYSYDGWPVPDPQWIVCATDVMHRPDLGVDCGELFAYWIREARASRMPWLKYLIWQARIYDVRHGWQEQRASGHFDHIHLSTRTDHIDTHLGSWSLTPEEIDMTPAQAAQLSACQTILDGLARGLDDVWITSSPYPDKDGKLSLAPFWSRVASEVVKKLPAGNSDAAAIAAALEPILRDAVADLGEGGAKQVRADE